MKQQQNHASVATSVGLALLCLLAYSQMRGLVYGAPILDETQAAGRPEPAGPPLLLLMDYNANDSLSFFCLTFPLVACESLPGDIFGRRWKTWSTRAGADAPGNTGQLPCDDLHWQGQNNPAVHEYMLPGGGKLFSGGKVENKIKVVVDIKVVQVGFWSLVSLAKMQSWDGGGGVSQRHPPFVLNVSGVARWGASLALVSSVFSLTCLDHPAWITAAFSADSLELVSLTSGLIFLFFSLSSSLLWYFLSEVVCS